MRIDESRMAVDDLDPAVLEHVDVDLAEAADLLVLRLDQRRPVKAWRHHRPTKACSVGKRFGELRAIDEQLLWHAAAQHAGAADAQLLADCDPCAVAAGAARARDPAGAGADRDHVEIIARHRWCTPSVDPSPGSHNARPIASAARLPLDPHPA